MYIQTEKKKHKNTKHFLSIPAIFKKPLKRKILGIECQKNIKYFL